MSTHKRAQTHTHTHLTKCTSTKLFVEEFNKALKTAVHLPHSSSHAPVGLSFLSLTIFLSITLSLSLSFSCSIVTVLWQCVGHRDRAGFYWGSKREGERMDERDERQQMKDFLPRPINQETWEQDKASLSRYLSLSLKHSTLTTLLSLTAYIPTDRINRHDHIHTNTDSPFTPSPLCKHTGLHTYPVQMACAGMVSRRTGRQWAGTEASP